jgi:hypothetical protein
MALIVKTFYEQTDDKESVNSYDGTGVGSASNPTGYSYSGNPDITDFSGSSISVYTPDPTSLLPISTAVVIDSSSVLPNVTGVPFEITSLAVFGETKAWDDGMYNFVLSQSTTTDPPTTYTSTYTVPIIAQVDCCINTKILAYSLCDINCDSLCNVLPLLLSRMMLDQLSVPQGRETGDVSNLESCSLFNKGAEIIIYAKQVCQDCGGCQSC